MGKSRIAVDPGGTTGIAVRLPNGDFETTTTTTSDQLYRFIIDCKPDELIYESFNPIKGRVDKYMLYTIELVGGIKALCHALQISGFARIPSSRKGYLDDSRALLRTKKRPFMVHEMDALAHLLAHEAKNGL